MGNKILEINHVSFSYDHQRVLEDVTLTVHRGDFLGILGPNGSGKSTLVKLALGLLSPQQGTIFLFGKPVQELKDRFRIGYVSQRSSGFNRGFPATVEEVVASGLYGKLGLFRRMKADHRRHVQEAIARVGLSDYRDRHIGQMSGGQQQRVFIARALVSQPEILILDEPTVGVDAKSTESFYELLTSLNQQQGCTLILVTHDIGVVTTYVNEVVCLNKRLYFHGGPSEFEAEQQNILSAVYGHDVKIIEHHHD